MDIVKIKNDLLDYLDKNRDISLNSTEIVINNDEDEIDFYVLERFKDIYQKQEKINNCNKNRLIKYKCCEHLYCCHDCHKDYHYGVNNEICGIYCIKCNNLQKETSNKITRCGKCYKPEIKTQFKRCIKSKKPCSICLDKLEGEMVIQLNCKHVIHKECYEELIKFSNKCPMCYKLIKKQDYKTMDLEIAMNPMTEEKIVDIYCYECETYSKCKYHYIGNKCIKCGLYNTREN
jgi:hypothetical protein